MSVLRITRGRVRPGSWDDYEAALRKTIAEVGNVPGLLSRTLARDSEDCDLGYAISLWENKEAIQKYESMLVVSRSRAQLHEFFVGDFDSALCDVRYWDETAFEDMPSI